MGELFEKTLPLRTGGQGGKMPPSTAAEMAAATDVNPTLNTYHAGSTLGVTFKPPLNRCMTLSLKFPAAVESGLTAGRVQEWSADAHIRVASV